MIITTLKPGVKADIWSSAENLTISKNERKVFGEKLSAFPMTYGDLSFGLSLPAPGPALFLLPFFFSFLDCLEEVDLTCDTVFLLKELFKEFHLGL